MQIILSLPFKPPEYVDSNYQDQSPCPSACSNCGDTTGVNRHGTYPRWISWLRGTLLILVARFLCRKCGRTMSLLPEWALSYRLVNAFTTQRYLEGERATPEVSCWESLLRSYEKRIDHFAATLIRAIHTGLGVRPSAPTEPVWPWIKKACGTLQNATRQLVSQFGITLFARYRCHQPCGFEPIPRG